MTKKSNHSKMLSEVVSLDAWHSAIRPDRKSLQVHVEVSFHQGRLGGSEEDFPFTFKISLKKAMLRLILEEPFSIDRASVARNVPDIQIEHTRIKSIRDELTAQAAAGGAINLSDFHAKLSGKIKSKTDRRREDELRVVQSLPPILISSQPGGANEYTWSLEPAYQTFLAGQPWDPVANPRMSARYDYDRVKKIAPSIRAEINCAFEDVIITDIKPKEPSLLEAVGSLLPSDPRTLAAQQHLKHVLRITDLEPGKMDNRFSDLLLASVIAMSN